MDNSRSPLDSLFFCATGATDRNWKALSGVGRIDPVAGGGAQYVTGGGGPGGGGGGGGAGPSVAAGGGGCGAVDGGGGGKNAVFRSKSPTEYRVPLFADCGATRRTGGGGGMTSICSRSPLDWTPPFIAGGEGGGGGRVLSRAVYLPSVALFSPGGGGGGGGMFGRCVGVDFLNEPPVSLGD